MMKTPIRFSVIIPAYNAATTIEASIASCLAQTCPPHEVIVVDDGSADDSKTFLDAAFGNRIKLVGLSKNSGPAAARNAGLAIATGTHIAFQDADDVWHREKLAHIAGILTGHPEIHFLFHPYTLSAVDFVVEKSLLEARRYPLWKLLLSNPIGTPCVVMQQDENIRFDEALHHMEDYELFLREAYRHGVYRIAVPFTQIGRPILSPGGQSAKRWLMRRGEILALLRFARHYPQYYLVVGPLILFALLKHFAKSFFPPRTNY